MKKLILLLMFLLTATFIFANEIAKINDGRFNVFSNGQISIGESKKTVTFKGQDLTIFVGIDKNHHISDMSLSYTIPKQDLEQIKVKILAANCFTTCSRNNKCSDKTTNFGVLGCYAECAIDCAQKAINDYQEDSLQQ